MEWFLIAVVIVLLLFIWVLLGFIFGMTNLYGNKQQDTCFDKFVMWPMNQIIKIAKGK